MSIVLFAMIGAAMNAPCGYWVCFVIYCVCHVMAKAWEELDD